MRLDHTVGEELDGGGAQERAGAAGPLLDRGGDLLVNVAVGLKEQRQQAPHVEFAAFVEQAVGLDRRSARIDSGLVHSRQAVARRDHPLEMPQAGQARLDIVVGERPIHPGPRFAQQARGGAVGQALDHGPTPLGRGGILTETNEPQRRRVQPLRVLTVVDEAHGPVGHHPVEQRRRHLALGQPRRVPAVAAHDDDGRVSGDEVVHGVEAVAQRVAVREIDLEELARRVTGVQMGIDEARQHQPTAEIDDLRARPPLLDNDLRPAHRDDASTGDRQSGMPRTTGVDGVDDAVSKDQIGGHGALLVGGSAGPASLPSLLPCSSRHDGLGRQSGALLEALDTVDRDVEHSRDVELCLDEVGLAGLTDRVGVDAAETELVAHVGHDRRIGEVEGAHPELVGHVALGLCETHAPGHLHAGYQISGCPHSAHARGLRVGALHAQRVTRAYL